MNPQQCSSRDCLFWCMAYMVGTIYNYRANFTLQSCSALFWDLWIICLYLCCGPFHSSMLSLVSIHSRDTFAERTSLATVATSFLHPSKTVSHSTIMLHMFVAQESLFFPSFYCFSPQVNNRVKKDSVSAVNSKGHNLWLIQSRPSNYLMKNLNIFDF